MDIYNIILDGFKNGKFNYKSEREILAASGLGGYFGRKVKSTLKRLCAEVEIVKLPQSNRYISAKEAHLISGTIVSKGAGVSFLIPDGCKERENDYFVPPRKTHDALAGDRVIALPLEGDEAVVLKILSYGLTRFCGTVERQGRFFTVVPDDKAISSVSVFLKCDSIGDIEVGDKVSVLVTKRIGKSLTVKIDKILGKAGELKTEEAAVIENANLRAEFPAQVLIAAAGVAAEKITAENRSDFRDVLTITIDGNDTRDIDDAVSLSRLGRYTVLGVHIADVSHYVKPKSVVDKEAYERGTSVYFPDRVLPMLPPSLSNGACSLNEGEDRYALSCIMYFDKNGARKKYEIKKSIIRSDRRMTYNEVTRILEDEEFAAGYGDIAEMIKNMAELCLLLEAGRKRSGAVAFDVKQAEIYVNEIDEIIIPEYDERTLSHRIIEQFMVAANESVAEFAEEKKAPFLYRVHEKPAEEKVRQLSAFVNGLGVKTNLNAFDPKPEDYGKIIKSVEDKPYSSTVNKVMLRSMQKARYCGENLGHFGLASKCYCHFTSPIRRYPDLFVHRVLKTLIDENAEEAEKRYKKFVGEAAKQTSECERRADIAERDVDDLYKAAYMQKHIGEEFDAVISGVTDGAVYAELKNAVEGKIPYTSLPEDDYEFFEERFLLKGRSHSFALGDDIRIRVERCDMTARRIYFSLAEPQKN